MKLSEALKNWIGFTTAWDWLYDPRLANDQVFNIFIDAYKKSQGYESLWSGSPEHVESSRI